MTPPRKLLPDKIRGVMAMHLTTAQCSFSKNKLPYTSELTVLYECGDFVTCRLLPCTFKTRFVIKISRFVCFGQDTHTHSRLKY